MTECGSGSDMSPRWMASLGRPDEAEVSRWILRVVNILGEFLDSSNLCHHLSVGQILITTIP